MRKKSKAKEELIALNFKVNVQDEKKIRELAKRHANGNLSAWLRMAGLWYIPCATDELLIDKNYNR